MSELLPLPLLFEKSTCYVSIGGATVATRVVDRVAILNLGITELRNELKSPNPVVGIDIINSGDLLLFYVKKKCLIIQFRHMMAVDYQTQIPQSLTEFLGDKSITFIGPRNISKKWMLSCKSESCREIELECDRIVDIGYLAAKILMKPKLLTATLEELMVEAGLDIKKPIVSEGSMRANWQSSSVLSNEEMQCAMYEVYSCYRIFELCDVNTSFQAASSNSFDSAVKVIASYVLVVLGGNNSPRTDDLKDMLGCVGAEADDDRIELLLSQVKGTKNIIELIAAGREKFAITVPTCGASAPESNKYVTVEQKEESETVRDTKEANQRTSGEEDKKPAGDQAALINLKIKSSDGIELFFRIKKSTRLKELMNGYCDRQSVDLNSTEFYFDHNLLIEEETPDELGMQDGDEIRAYSY